MGDSVEEKTLVNWPMALLTLAVVLVITLTLIGKFSSYSECESSDGVLVENSCYFDFSEGVTPRFFANSEDDAGNKLYCCAPMDKTSKEDFQKWIEENGGVKTGSAIIVDGTIGFQINGENSGVIVPSNGSLENVYVDENITIYAVKRIKEGSYCTLSIYGLSEFAGKISKDEESVFEEKTSDCKLDTKLALEDINLSYRELEEGIQGKGLYEVEMLVFDKKSKEKPLTSWSFNIQLMDKS